MGIFRKLFGGDAGIREAMYETYSKVKSMHPGLEEHEILALVLHYRYRKLPPEIGLMIAVLFPRIEILTQWVVDLENSGGPRHLDEYLAYTTTSGDRENALNYIQEKALHKALPKSKYSESSLKDYQVSEEVVDVSAETLWNKFDNKLNYSFNSDAKPLDHLSDELRNTVANIYYRYFQFCTENPTDCENIEKKIQETKKDVDQKKGSWEMSLEAILTLMVL